LAHEAWQTRYEQLRSQVLQVRGIATSCGCGHALLLQRGLAAWMKAWPATPAPAPERETPAQDAAPLPWPLQQQLAQILVTTILDHVQEICV
jgi:hypothetical protein